MVLIMLAASKHLGLFLQQKGYTLSRCKKVNNMNAKILYVINYFSRNRCTDLGAPLGFKPCASFSHLILPLVTLSSSSWYTVNSLHVISSIVHNFMYISV